ncbi:hypothetical protein HN011_000739 [Eciton burchellii]|nr:hypothetical protein HN011_000739 [Eciton burchellii]
MNGVIWSKTQQTFVPISNIPIYVKIQQERLEKSRMLETYNFQLQNLTLTSFEEPYFLHFYNNDTKISGLYGEIWNLLSTALNFTLQPVRVNVDGLGKPDENFIYTQGLLGIISRKETIVIPKVEIYRPRLAACDFTMPFWINKYYLYIYADAMYDNTWMIKVFSWKIWVTALMMHVLIIVCSFLVQKIIVRMNKAKHNRSFGEHVFYNYRNFCNQSILSEYFDGSLRIVEISSSLFSIIINMAFGALLFIYITKNAYIPPFDSLESLVDTDYDIATMKNSIGDVTFKIANFSPALAQIRRSKRIAITSTIEEMYRLACSSRKKKYAIYEGEDEYKLRGNIVCHVKSAGKPCFKAYIGSGIAKNFKYKRTMDLGVIKLMETGLLNALSNRWLKQKTGLNFKQDDNTAKPIKIQQVSLIIGVACFGIIIALIIFIIENIVFVYKTKYS